MLAMSKTDVNPGSTETQQLRVMVSAAGVSNTTLFDSEKGRHFDDDEVFATSFFKLLTENDLYSTRLSCDYGYGSRSVRTGPRSRSKRISRSLPTSWPHRK